MREQFRQYIINLYQDIPQEVYEGLLSVFCLGLVVFVAWKGFKTGFRYSAILLLVEYIFLLFCSTVIFRSIGAISQYDFHPFWSYKAIQDGRENHEHHSIHSYRNDTWFTIKGELWFTVKG